jgi:hypothetical protein
MFRRFLVIFSAIILLSEISTGSVSAVNVPDFPTCNNPPESIRAYHNDGLHGVVGNVSEYRGKDVVYNVTGANFLQCLCTDDGEGIATNWWRISSLSENEIQILKNQGWYYIVDGALWGLDNAPYMAKNNEYACRESSGGVGGGEVLGLAVTGDKAQFYSIFGIVLGSIILLLGFLFLRRAK